MWYNQFDINRGQQFLNHIKHQTDTSHGETTLELLSVLQQHYPNIDPLSNIDKQYPTFLKYIHDRFDITPYRANLPFIPYNIRGGIYRSIVGMVAEYCSYLVCTELFSRVNTLQDYNNQVSGNDLEYISNDRHITADVKATRVQNNIIHTHDSWFTNDKQSTRIHIVDLSNKKHYIVGRSALKQLHQDYLGQIGIKTLKAFATVTITDITPYLGTTQ
jgi:hypothetical protein